VTGPRVSRYLCSRDLTTARNAALFVAFVTASVLAGVAYHEYAEEALVRVAQRLLRMPGAKQAVTDPPEKTPRETIKGDTPIQRVEA
jgi:hypothetical protein